MGTKRHEGSLVLVGRRCAWPEGIPGSAQFEQRGRDEHSIWGLFTYDNGQARVCWALKTDHFATRGRILFEQYFDSHGVQHELELSRQKDATIQWQVPWVRGQMHGIARQFDDEGRELYRARFTNGSGVDLWLEAQEITELRVLRTNTPHGVERWGHPLLPYEECHWIRGKRAGIIRRWDGLALKESFPKYVIDDNELSRAEYLRARRSRPELPRDDRKDDQRARQLHPSLRRVWLRADVRASLRRRPGADERIGRGSGSRRV